MMEWPPKRHTAILLCSKGLEEAIKGHSVLHKEVRNDKNTKEISMAIATITTTITKQIKRKYCVRAWSSLILSNLSIVIFS